MPRERHRCRSGHRCAIEQRARRRRPAQSAPPGEGWRLVAAQAITQTTKASTPAAMTMAQTAGTGW
ncbi:hypothetical protein AB0H88_37715 [Nonomuraea sp. NPDC050680]|uniref:hypothetical protein n=1 Tax=Nonomuraea sp. NPDC050680 TaxID=3154630 RepID=UPI0033DB0354